MTIPQAMFYPTNNTMTQYSPFEEHMYNDAAQLPSRGFSWQDDVRRSPADMSSFSQSYMSDMRTPIVESPQFSSHMLPTSDGGMMHSMYTGAHVPRSVGFAMGSPSSTDSDDGSETTASSQWRNYNSPYEGKPSSYHRLSRSSTSSPDYSGLSVQIPNYIPQSWPLVDSAVTQSPFTPHQQSVTINGYVFPDRFSPIPTPSPPPNYNDTLPIPPSTKNTSLAGARRTNDGVKKCSHCQATSTPLWRRDPSTFKPLCNACGLYLQQRNRLRPQVLIDADTDDGNTTDDSDQNYVGPECSHCRTHHTSVWRRSKTGAQLCNACGVYLRLRGKPRPLHLKKNKIKPRSKHPKD